MKLSRARGIYSSPEKWERIRRRARRLRMPISRLVVLCCLRAADEDGPLELPGHPLALGEEVQRRLLEDVRVAARAARIAVRAPGKGEAELVVHEAVQILLLTEEAREGRNAFVEKRKPDFSAFRHQPW